MLSFYVHNNSRNIEYFLFIKENEMVVFSFLFFVAIVLVYFLSRSEKEKKAYFSQHEQDTNNQAYRIENISLDDNSKLHKMCSFLDYFLDLFIDHKELANFIIQDAKKDIWGNIHIRKNIIDDNSKLVEVSPRYVFNYLDFLIASPVYGGQFNLSQNKLDEEGLEWYETYKEYLNIALKLQLITVEEKEDKISFVNKGIKETPQQYVWKKYKYILSKYKNI